MKIYWDRERRRLLKSATNSQEWQKFEFVLADLIDLTVYPVVADTSTGGYTVEEIAAGRSIICGIKLNTVAGLDGGYLASQQVFTKSGSGTGVSYTATLDLSSTQLRSALSGVTELATFLIEFTERDTDQRDHNSTQVDVTIFRELNIATEAAASSVYNMVNSLAIEEIINGVKVIILRNSDGVEYGRFNPPGA